MIAACDLMKYYELVDRPLTVQNIRWNVIKSHQSQWKALKDKKELEAPDTPKITRTFPIIKWLAAFEDHLRQLIGVCMVPLYYVVCPDVPVGAAPPLAVDQAHSTEYGSVEIELTNRASHADPLFREDNQKVYFLIEEATRGISSSEAAKSEATMWGK